jgi:hypothetical protein
MVNKKLIEVLNHLLTFIVYTMLLVKSIQSSCFSMSDSSIVLANIIFSIGITFFLWSVKD